MSGCKNPSLQRLVSSTTAALLHMGTSWQRATLSMPLRLQLPSLSCVSFYPSALPPAAQIAAIFEFGGAMLLGRVVTSTIAGVRVLLRAQC